MLLVKYINLLRLTNDIFCQYIKGIPGESVIPTPLRLKESPRIRNRIFGNRTKPMGGRRAAQGGPEVGVNGRERNRRDRRRRENENERAAREQQA